MARFLIAKEFWIDIGHRMYSHDLTKDRGSALVKDTSNLGWKRFKDIYPHGHTIRIKIFVESLQLDGQSMIVDTDKIKQVIREFEDVWDHAFVLGKDDPLKETFLNLFEGVRVVVLDDNPTAEVMAAAIFDFFDKRFRELLPAEEYPDGFKIARIDMRTATTASIEYEPSY